MPYRNPLPSAAAFSIRASVVVGLSRKIVSMPDARHRLLKLPGFFDREIEREHAVNARTGGLARELGDAEAQQRVRVAEDDDRRRDVRPDFRDQFERSPEAPAGGQRPLGRALDHRTVGQGIGKRNADFEHVRARTIQRPQQFGRPRQIGIGGRRIRDQPRPLLEVQTRECRR